MDLPKIFLFKCEPPLCWVFFFWFFFCTLCWFYFKVSIQRTVLHECNENDLAVCCRCALPTSLELPPALDSPVFETGWYSGGHFDVNVLFVFVYIKVT
uniref:Uncharacterized protein n=1 Tax=Ixodes ricinus TaxID=34613 RepID=A0A6B0UFB3_IXORI